MTGRRAATSLGLAGIAMIGLALAWTRLGSGDPIVPVEGVRYHDFGTRTFESDEPLEMEHTFVLRNASGRLLRIKGVKSSCGCTHATPTSMEIEAGAPFEIAVSLLFRDGGRRRERVWLAFDDGSVCTLTVAGTARRSAGMFSTRECVLLSPTEPSHITLFVISGDESVVPVLPRFDAPEGVEAVAHDWILVHGADPSRGLQCRWQGGVTVRGTPARLPSESPLIVHWDAQTAEIGLNGFPW